MPSYQMAKQFNKNIAQLYNSAIKTEKKSHFEQELLWFSIQKGMCLVFTLILRINMATRLFICEKKCMLHALIKMLHIYVFSRNFFKK